MSNAYHWMDPAPPAVVAMRSRRDARWETLCDNRRYAQYLAEPATKESSAPAQSLAGLPSEFGLSPLLVAGTSEQTSPSAVLPSKASPL